MRRKIHRLVFNVFVGLGVAAMLGVEAIAAGGGGGGAAGAGGAVGGAGTSAAGGGSGTAAAGSATVQGNGVTGAGNGASGAPSGMTAPLNQTPGVITGTQPTTGSNGAQINFGAPSSMTPSPAANVMNGLGGANNHGFAGPGSEGLGNQPGFSNLGTYNNQGLGGFGSLGTMSPFSQTPNDSGIHGVTSGQPNGQVRINGVNSPLGYTGAGAQFGTPGANGQVNPAGQVGQPNRNAQFTAPYTNGQYGIGSLPATQNTTGLDATAAQNGTGINGMTTNPPNMNANGTTSPGQIGAGPGSPNGARFGNAPLGTPLGNLQIATEGNPTAYRGGYGVAAGNTGGVAMNQVPGAYGAYGGTYGGQFGYVYNGGQTAAPPATTSNAAAPNSAINGVPELNSVMSNVAPMLSTAAPGTTLPNAANAGPQPISSLTPNITSNAAPSPASNFGQNIGQTLIPADSFGAYGGTYGGTYGYIYGQNAAAPAAPVAEPAAAPPLEE